MAQRAFVRYTKKGHIVPGSLIVTTKGGYPKDGTYKEVIVDQCCGNQALRYNPTTGEASPTGTTFPIADPFPWTTDFMQLAFGCVAMNMDAEWSYLYIPGTPATLQELIQILNERASYVGTFEIAEDGETIILNVNPEVAGDMCRGPLTETFGFYVTED
jgi:hypothetical protein